MLCKLCNEPITEFAKNRSRCKCKRCYYRECTARRRNRRATDPEYAWRRALQACFYDLKRRNEKIPFTFADLVIFAEKKMHGCEICGAKDELCIDHDHGTGELRGILCKTCNRAIGLLNDDVGRLESAIRYLKADR